MRILFNNFYGDSSIFEFSPKSYSFNEIELRLVFCTQYRIR